MSPVSLNRTIFHQEQAVPHPPRPRRSLAILFVSLSICFAAPRLLLAEEPSSWKQHTINHRSPFEAVGVADF
jgi:hypothetical protein